MLSGIHFSAHSSGLITENTETSSYVQFFCYFLLFIGSICGNFVIQYVCCLHLMKTFDVSSEYVLF